MSPVHTKGFTGHEMLSEVGLVHMNGRIYDPALGRFMSADPHIQYAHNTQSFNRYSYVLNNPVGATDPTGYFTKWLRQMNDKHSWFRDLVPAVSLLAGYAAGVVTFAVTGDINAASAAAGFVSGFSSAYLSGAGVRKSLQNGALGAGLALVTSGLNETLFKVDIPKNSSLAASSGAGGISTPPSQASGVGAGAKNPLPLGSIELSASYHVENNNRVAYENLATRFKEEAIENPNGVSTITMEEINLMVTVMQYEASRLPRYTFNSEDQRSQFRGFDTFMWRVKHDDKQVLLDRVFVLGHNQYYLGGELNYIAVGALAGHYGGPTRFALWGMVNRWNAIQMISGEGVNHNLRQMIYGYEWARYAADRK